MLSSHTYTVLYGMITSSCINVMGLNPVSSPIKMFNLNRLIAEGKKA